MNRAHHVVGPADWAERARHSFRKNPKTAVRGDVSTPKGRIAIARADLGLDSHMPRYESRLLVGEFAGVMRASGL
jgi:hypothetical protein